MLTSGSPRYYVSAAFWPRDTFSGHSACLRQTPLRPRRIARRLHEARRKHGTRTLH